MQPNTMPRLGTHGSASREGRTSSRRLAPRLLVLLVAAASFGPVLGGCAMSDGRIGISPEGLAFELLRIGINEAARPNPGTPNSPQAR